MPSPRARRSVPEEADVAVVGTALGGLIAAAILARSDGRE
jgi:ribulose 1,5-bisphosphate synthetase/thiazole synthase